MADAKRARPNDSTHLETHSDHSKPPGPVLETLFFSNLCSVGVERTSDKYKPTLQNAIETYRQCASEKRYSKKARLHAGKDAEDIEMPWKGRVSAIERLYDALRHHIQTAAS